MERQRFQAGSGGSTDQMMFNKQEEKRTRWNEIIQNKERNIENNFKHQKELMVK
jgi:hypothetical protein|tara:strand:- start:1144 stop:1305 length:162 start_codon:yes stop_codon:yes gene_type:complete